MMNHTMEKGAILYLAIIVLFIILGIGIGIGSLLTTELKTVRSSGESLQAFYAADAGIEVLLRVRYCITAYPGPDPDDQDDRIACIEEAINHTGNLPPLDCAPDMDDAAIRLSCTQYAIDNLTPTTRRLDNGSTYTFCKSDVSGNGSCDIEDPGVNCSGIEYCAKSIGTFKQTNRAIGVSR